MTPDPLMQDELLNYLGQLDSDGVSKVVHFARTLATSSKHGTAGKEFLRAVGTIPHEDLEQMKQIIEDGCERVDVNEW